MNESESDGPSNGAPGVPLTLLPDFDGPDTPFEFQDTPWGPAFAVPLTGPLPNHDAGLIIALIEKEAIGSDDLDYAVNEAVGDSFPEGTHRPDHAAAIRHALLAALFHLRAYVSAEASAMLRLKQDGVTPPGGAAIARFDPFLVFEAEAAILQLRAALDAVARAIASEGMKGPASYGKLRGALKRWLDPRAAELLRIVDGFRSHFVRLERIRNFIAHPNPSPTTPSFGSFMMLPYVHYHSTAWVAPPLYERQRAKDVLLELESGVRSQIRSLLRVLWR